ncbi:MAG: hypothetical protein CSA54_04510 [Gammaproteobacteria bacterium]|nr:MAG: hypothetical protein CSA54_04510 [Gammaproteobacteria bacterium]
MNAFDDRGVRERRVTGVVVAHDDAMLQQNTGEAAGAGDDVVVRGGQRDGVRLQVALDGAARCRECAKGGGCGALRLTTTEAPVFLHCVSERALPAGTPVDITIDEQGTNWLWPVALAYGLPTLGLLIGAVLPSIIGISMPVSTPGSSTAAGAESDAVTALAAVFGLAGGLIAGRFGMNYWQHHSAGGSCLGRALDGARVVVRHDAEEGET